MPTRGRGGYRGRNARAREVHPLLKDRVIVTEFKENDDEDYDKNRFVSHVVAKPKPEVIRENAIRNPNKRREMKEETRERNESHRLPGPKTTSTQRLEQKYKSDNHDTHKVKDQDRNVNYDENGEEIVNAKLYYSELDIEVEESDANNHQNKQNQNIRNTENTRKNRQETMNNKNESHEIETETEMAYNVYEAKDYYQCSKCNQELFCNYFNFTQISMGISNLVCTPCSIHKPVNFDQSKLNVYKQQSTQPPSQSQVHSTHHNNTKQIKESIDGNGEVESNHSVISNSDHDSRRQHLVIEMKNIGNILSTHDKDKPRDDNYSNMATEFKSYKNDANSSMNGIDEIDEIIEVNDDYEDLEDIQQESKRSSCVAEEDHENSNNLGSKQAEVDRYYEHLSKEEQERNENNNNHNHNTHIINQNKDYHSLQNNMKMKMNHDSQIQRQRPAKGDDRDNHQTHNINQQVSNKNTNTNNDHMDDYNNQVHKHENSHANAIRNAHNIQDHSSSHKNESNSNGDKTHKNSLDKRHNSSERKKSKQNPNTAHQSDTEYTHFHVDRNHNDHHTHHVDSYNKSTNKNNTTEQQNQIQNHAQESPTRQNKNEQNLVVYNFDKSEKFQNDSNVSLSYKDFMKQLENKQDSLKLQSYIDVLQVPHVKPCKPKKIVYYECQVCENEKPFHRFLMPEICLDCLRGAQSAEGTFKCNLCKEWLETSDYSSYILCGADRERYVCIECDMRDKNY